MEFNILLAFYRMLNDKPDNFYQVLRNLYSREIQVIKNRIEDGIGDIDIEKGEREDRDHYFGQKVEDLTGVFDSLVLIAICFRKVDMHGFIGADDLSFALQEMKDEIQELAEKTKDEVKRIRKAAKDAGVGGLYRVGEFTELDTAEEEMLNEFKQLKDSIFSELRSLEDQLDDINNTRL